MLAHDIGVALAGAGAAKQAEAALRAALAADPSSAITRHALGWSLLAQGRFEEGWPLYDARHELPGAPAKPSLPFPEWQGEDLSGKRFLIFPEQGFGDQIMYSRFALTARDAGADVTIVCWPALARLFAENYRGVRVIAANGAVEFPDPDFWVMFSSLPGRFGARPDSLPASPYLTEAGTAAPRGVGVIVAGSPTHANDRNRSLPADQAARLRAWRGAVDLAPDATGAADFLDTARIIAGLELVITVDTAVAHLAGAMGKPVWILLPALMGDWRWEFSAQRSPWYPSARLFRQAQGESWSAVVDRIEATMAFPS